MFSQASTMRENLHCWRPGATATPLSSLNHNCPPMPTLFVIASCASCVTTACSIGVRAHNIILTFHGARRRIDRLRGSKTCTCLPQIRGTQAFGGPSHESAAPRSRLHPLCSAKRRRGKSFSNPSAARLSIDRSGLTHPVSRASSPGINQSTDR